MPLAFVEDDDFDKDDEDKIKMMPLTMTMMMTMTRMIQDEQRNLLIFASCYLVAMTSVCTNPIM